MKLKKCIFCFFTIILTFLIVGCSPIHSTEKIKIQQENSLGTWWWSKNLDIDEYLTFAKENGITEIYYCDYSLDEKVSKLVEKANTQNIKVFLLAGEKEWIENRKGLDNLIENYNNFQSSHTYKLAGIHLDIEPHQFSDFSQNRASYLLKLVTLMNENKQKYNSIQFDYDIPFWLDDIIEYNGQSKETYKHIIDVADRTFIMSYRDTAQKMKDVSIEEINYALEQNKIVYLAAETYSEEGNSVSFYEEGKEYMMQQLSLLRQDLPQNFGIAIHNIKTWKELID